MNDSDLVNEVVCPYCQSTSFKFKEKNTWMFLCHNCQRYLHLSKTPLETKPIITSEYKYDNILSLCQKVSELESAHPCKQYCIQRKIPLDLVYYTEHFNKISEYAETPVKDTKRLILPFFDQNGNLFAVQGRSLDGSGIRYITFMFNKNKKKIFGLDRVDLTKKFVVVEGPIDSFFVNNCIAFAGSEALPNKYSTKAVICYDNEPRNKHIVKKIKKALDDGFETVIWPSTITEKDINDMVLAGHDVNQLINDNTYSGLMGVIKLNEWKKT